MNRFLSLILFFALTSCTKKEVPFDMFVFSVGSYTKDFSVKIDNSDTVYYQNRFKMKTGRNYYAVPKKADMDSLVAIIKKLEFSRYDTFYLQQNLMDGAGIKFLKRKGKTEDWVYFYGDIDPKDLNVYANKLYILTKRISFKPYSKKIDLGNLKYVQIPEVPFTP
ncbi:hypothetical protein AAEO56_07605 [Flavobacterium sp. DGU11]|uniref:Uncharacterized protein n=1 Tax=Flavobacterium arundinis TaxID=3139143 RepID=A0ABU9HWE5_9FLAO